MKSSILSSFRRTSRSRPCPVCHKPDWCLVSTDDPEAPPLALCKRVESPVQWGSAGYLHRLRSLHHVLGARRRTIVSASPAAAHAELGHLAEQAAARVHYANSEAFAATLSISLHSLTRLGLGWMDPTVLADLGMRSRSGVWSFPMRLPTGCACGIRLRTDGGFKFAVAGSRNGLFLPDGLVGPLALLLIAEGESDTAALLDMGFDAIGRPGAGNANELVLSLVRNIRPLRVVVVGDNDSIGQVKATHLARKLAPHIPDTRVILPPPSIKDAREWKKSGATCAAVSAAIDAAKPVRFMVTATRKGV